MQCMHSLSEYDERIILVHTGEKCYCSMGACHLLCTLPPTRHCFIQTLFPDCKYDENMYIKYNHMNKSIRKWLFYYNHL